MIPQKLNDDLKNIPRYKSEKFNIEKFLAESEESTLFDQVFGSKLKRNEGNNSNNNNLNNNTRISSENPSQTEFTTLLSSRLVTIEQENKELRRLLAQSNTKVIALEEERQQLTELLQANNKHIDLVTKLRHENNQLTQQLSEMEQFLSDYGLVWVGGNGRSKDIHNNHTNNKSSLNDNNNNFNFDLFIQKIEELNAVVLSEPAQIVTSTEGSRVRARLAHAEQRLDHIPLTIFKNGILIRRGPFRSIGSQSFQSFVEDILDGYFPSEFKSNNPDGVIFKVTDKRIETFSEGFGNSLPEDQKMKTSQFLNRLPKTVVKEGNLISVRDDISSKFDLKEEKSSINTSSSQHTIKSQAHRSLESGDELFDEITTIRIKVPSIGEAGSSNTVTYQIKMYASDLIDDLINELKNELNKQGVQLDNIRLRGSHPPCPLDSEQTLRYYNLVPNGTVYLERT